MIKHLALSGGANKCLVFVGAIQALEELNILSHITHFAGTSAGAILSLLLVLGYSVSNILELYKELNFYDLLDINTTHILQFFNNFGLDNGDTFIHIVKYVIRKKTGNEIITFKKLYEITHKTLIITGTCVEKECVEYFDHIRTPNMPVYLAIRISMGLPFIFNRIIYNNLSYIDGGFLEYLPVRYFENNTHTLALGIKNISLDAVEAITSIEEYVYKMFCGLYRIHQNNLIHTYDGHSIFFNIPFGNLENIDIQAKQNIIDIGYKDTMKYMHTYIIRDIVDILIRKIENNATYND